MIVFARRNLRIFFRDRSAVFFSMLSALIIVGLYALFLGDALQKGLGDVTGARYLMDSWIMAGLLAASSVTTTMGALGTMIEDKRNKIYKDFAASPIKRSGIAGGYILSAFVVGVIMCLVSLVLAEAYIVLSGGQLASAITLLKTLGLILLSSLTGTSLMLFLVTLFKSVRSYSAASTVIGTLIGFITGIYLPIGSLPEAMQWVVKLFPMSHAAALLRQTMMAAPMEVTFAGAPAQAVMEFKRELGVEFAFGDTIISPQVSVIILLVTAAVFFGLAIFNLSRQKD